MIEHIVSAVVTVTLWQCWWIIKLNRYCNTQCLHRQSTKWPMSRINDSAQPTLGRAKLHLGRQCLGLFAEESQMKRDPMSHYPNGNGWSDPWSFSIICPIIWIKNFGHSGQNDKISTARKMIISQGCMAKELRLLDWSNCWTSTPYHLQNNFYMRLYTDRIIR